MKYVDYDLKTLKNIFRKKNLDLDLPENKLGSVRTMLGIFGGT